MNLNVNIEKLVLEGLPATVTQGPHLQRAIEAELTRLLRTSGLSSDLHHAGAVPHVNAAPISLANEHTPVQLGNRIALSVHAGISNSNERGPH